MPPVTPAPVIAERDASAYIGLSIAWLRKARREGRGPAYVQVGRTIRYRIADLDRWLTAHLVTTRESRESRAS